MNRHSQVYKGHTIRSTVSILLVMVLIFSMVHIEFANGTLNNAIGSGVIREAEGSWNDDKSGYRVSIIDTNVTGLFPR